MKTTLNSIVASTLAFLAGAHPNLLGEAGGPPIPPAQPSATTSRDPQPRFGPLAAPTLRQGGATPADLVRGALDYFGGTAKVGHCVIAPPGVSVPFALVPMFLPETPRGEKERQDCLAYLAVFQVRRDERSGDTWLHLLRYAKLDPTGNTQCTLFLQPRDRRETGRLVVLYGAADFVRGVEPQTVEEIAREVPTVEGRERPESSPSERPISPPPAPTHRGEKPPSRA